jgi:O-methyltransferase domain
MTATTVTVERAGAAVSQPRRAPRTGVPPGFVVHAAMRLRHLLLRAADRLLPSELAVLEHSVQFSVGYLLAAIAELGVADELTRGPKTAAELAAAAGCDAGALHRALRAAAVSGLVRLDRTGRFHATRLTRALATDAPYSSAEWCAFMMSPSHQAAWSDLAASIRSGEPAFRRIHGMSLFQWFEAHPAEGVNFAAGLSGLTLSEAPAIVASYPFPSTGTVCDVAGGVGVLLAEVLRRHQGLRGTLVEAPSVLIEAASYLGSAGVADRVALVSGDFFGEVRAEADLYLLKWILHDWDDAGCVRILRNLADAMPSGAKLLVLEGDQNANTVDPRFSAIDLQMLVVSEGGCERSVEQIQVLLATAGLTPGTVRYTPARLAVVEAIKP